MKPYYFSIEDALEDILKGSYGSSTKWEWVVDDNLNERVLVPTFNQDKLNFAHLHKMHLADLRTNLGKPIPELQMKRAFGLACVFGHCWAQTEVDFSKPTTQAEIAFNNCRKEFGAASDLFEIKTSQGPVRHDFYTKNFWHVTRERTVIWHITYQGTVELKFNDHKRMENIFQVTVFEKNFEHNFAPIYFDGNSFTLKLEPGIKITVPQVSIGKITNFYIDLVGNCIRGIFIKSEENALNIELQTTDYMRDLVHNYSCYKKELRSRS